MSTAGVSRLAGSLHLPLTRWAEEAYGIRASSGTQRGTPVIKTVRY